MTHHDKPKGIAAAIPFFLSIWYHPIRIIWYFHYDQNGV